MKKRSKSFANLSEKEVAMFMKRWRMLCIIKAEQRANKCFSVFDDEEEIDREFLDEFIHKDTFVGHYLIACEDSLRIFLELVKAL